MSDTLFDVSAYVDSIMARRAARDAAFIKYESDVMGWVRKRGLSSDVAHEAIHMKSFTQLFDQGMSPVTAAAILLAERSATQRWQRRVCPACKSDAITCVTDPGGTWIECDDCGNFGYLH